VHLVGLLGLVGVADAQPVGHEVVALEAAVVGEAEIDQVLGHVLAHPVADRRAEADRALARELLEGLDLLLEVAPLLLGRRRLDPAHREPDLVGRVVHAVRGNLVPARVDRPHGVREHDGGVARHEERRLELVAVEQLEDPRHPHRGSELAARQRVGGREPEQPEPQGQRVEVEAQAARHPLRVRRSHSSHGNLSFPRVTVNGPADGGRRDATQLVRASASVGE
jgi:hypothetical protein